MSQNYVRNVSTCKIHTGIRAQEQIGVEIGITLYYITLELFTVAYVQDYIQYTVYRTRNRKQLGRK